MEFGHLSPGELNQLTFKLPPDPPGNARVLASATGTAQTPKVFVGCAKWGRSEWVGKIYPKGTREKDFLEAYAKHFNSIELNATNYLFYKPEKIEEWVSKIHRPDFLFCPKAHRAVSFMGPSDKKAEFTELFFESITHFKQYLGPVYMTFNGKYNTAYQDYFFDYIQLFAKVWPLFVEQRDPAFFADNELQEQYYETLTDLGVGTVITDTAGRPDVLNIRLTMPKAFIRFVGNSLHASDFPRIHHWVERIRQWLDAGIKEVYFFLHMHDEGLSPEIARYAVDQLNKRCGLSLPPVVFVR